MKFCICALLFYKNHFSKYLQPISLLTTVFHIEQKICKIMILFFFLLCWLVSFLFTSLGCFLFVFFFWCFCFCFAHSLSFDHSYLLVDKCKGLQFSISSISLWLEEITSLLTSSDILFCHFLQDPFLLPQWSTTR